MGVGPNMRALTVCLCVWLTSCTAHGEECGENPIRQVVMVAKRTGRTLTHVLSLLQDIDPPAYETLARKFRMYAACVGLVDTGYFRKRSWPTADDSGDESYQSKKVNDDLERHFQYLGRIRDTLQKPQVRFPGHLGFFVRKRPARDAVPNELIKGGEYFR